MMIRVWVAAVLVVFAAASSNGRSEVTESLLSGETSTTLATAANGATVERLQIDGVWVFQHEPEAAMEALYSGTPKIVDGCLFIDDTIIVWHIDRIEEAAAAIAAANAGESPPLLIGGGPESSQIPSIITDRCPTSAVWYGAP